MDRDWKKLLEELPQKPPFRYVSGVKDFNPETKELTATLFVDPAWPCFEGHFTGTPVMPGVLILEALFQASALLVAVLRGGESAEAVHGKVGVVVGLEKTRFKKVVRPGETLELKVSLSEWVGDLLECKGLVRSEGKVVCKSSFRTTEVNKSEVL